MTASGPLLSNNSTNLSYTESQMDSVNHETTHRPLKETATTTVTGNLQPQHPTDGTHVATHYKIIYTHTTT